jgi:AcrR family transcriptional regulator
VTRSKAHSIHLAQRRQMTADERRQQIIDRSAVLFDSQPYHSTTMDDIAASVGVAKPTLYHYFKSKSEILFEIHEDLIERLLSRHGGQREGSPSEQLLAIMIDILGFMQSRPGHMRVFFEHYRELPAREQETIRLKREQFQSILEQVLADGVEAGEFGDIDISITSFQIFGACIWAYQWYVPSGRLQPEEIARQFWQQFMSGISTTASASMTRAGRQPGRTRSAASRPGPQASACESVSAPEGKPTAQTPRAS